MLRRLIPALAAAMLGACGTDSPTAPADPWEDANTLISSALAANGNPALGVIVWNSRDQRIFDRMYNGFRADQRVAVASASKMISAAVIFDLIRTGHLSLDLTTGAALGWQGSKGTITLRHLLSFTSGLQPNALCSFDVGVTLGQCVAVIGAAATVAPPGVRFDYGSTHLHVAARMAELATGRTWNNLFRERIADLLALPAAVQFYTLPRNAIGTQNPLVAGGLRATMEEYGAMLGLIFHRGAWRNLSIGAPALFDAQTREPYPAVTIGSSPVANLGLTFRYGLGAWLECSTPAAGCSTISSPGAFGWTPWLDRTTGYYAIIGTELNRLDEGVVNFSVNLAQGLKPLIAASLRPNLTQ